MSKKTVETTTSGLQQAVGRSTLAPLATEEVTELGTYFPKSGGGGSGFEPTEAQLEAMNSGITSAKVEAYDTLPDEDDVKDLISDHFVAGTNVTITDNVDGTQTISSTASGGTSDYSDLTNKPSINNVTLSGNKTTADLGISEVPAITSSDDGKFLKALYDSTDVNYEWATLPTEIPQVTSTDSGKVLTATYSGGTGSYAWADSSAPTPPTAYTAPTAGTHVTTVSGGYVVSNNICTINICFTMSSHSAGEVVFSDLPVPALKPGSDDISISTVFTLGSLSNSSTGKTGIHVYLTQGGSIVLSDEAWNNLGASSKLISGSYLVDTST